MESISFNYDASLVTLSILVAFFSSFVALDISSRLAAASGPNQLRWIISGAAVMGLGIWAMHFIAMLAFHLSVAVSYNLPLVFLSIIPALVSSGIAFYLISTPAATRLHLFSGAFFIGMGAIAMHYLGMASMDLGADISYDPILYLLSVGMAFATSIVALSRLFYLREMQGFHWKKAASAALMSMGIAGFHYTAMEAAIFSPTIHHVSKGVALEDGKSIGYGIGTGILIILLLALGSIRIDKKLLAQREESERKFQTVIESAHDAIIVADQFGTIVHWNHGAKMIFGYEKEEVLGLDIEMIVPGRFKNVLPKGIQGYHLSKIEDVAGKIIEVTGVRKNGDEFPLEMSLSTWQTDEGTFFSSIIRDVTERKQSEEKINSLVYLDPLTGLPNRRLFHERLDQALNEAAEKENIFSLLYLDLDHFKLINDTFGHSIGDQLLVEATERLQRHATQEDLIARLGGDEFILLLPHAGRKKAANLARGLLKSFEEPFHFNGEEMFVSLSIGISRYPEDGKDQETLIKNADLALYRTKDIGRNGFHFHTSEMNEIVIRKSKLASSLRTGLENGEFVILYQPQIDLKTEKIIGVEALVRWNHPKLGTISPAEFIPLAEETGSIIPIGEYVLRKACQQSKAWQDAGLPPFRVAINISARQFTQTNLAETVKSALEESGLSPQYLELELTESIIQGSKSSIATMQELKKMGIHLSIDDFGTGYSSLSYLKLFPIDSLKIDQYFTRNIQVDSKDAALVDTIIRMGHNLNLNVIAEGVETAEQLDFLKSRLCDQAQGYYFNKPLPAEEISKIYCQKKSEYALS
ncbi:PAS domain S-box-containing protein/diguanylate cyclase (GGDEF)-like protein [Planomicrobium soli]|uniref:PAS domain S-box-containing protein/diguanylate cyclase (GGDEF)-like protein n=1 Tax=Planomicrobium soli TaxID=1176648 RepID=A0A2P8H3G4_9BACL|nr:EAL domain-containing protein [Planomicrobium soli]PSL40747.1 PAS domain S-box-containing protein/diguanylate cyclase (GGDEF)-like protein [Planomicrobium soli]